jgi:hypothetical protein
MVRQLAVFIGYSVFCDQMRPGSQTDSRLELTRVYVLDTGEVFLHYRLHRSHPYEDRRNLNYDVPPLSSLLTPQTVDGRLYPHVSGTPGENDDAPETMEEQGFHDLSDDTHMGLLAERDSAGEAHMLRCRTIREHRQNKRSYSQLLLCPCHRCCG